MKGLQISKAVVYNKGEKTNETISITKEDLENLDIKEAMDRAYDKTTTDLE
ncbi:MAG: hypothetical protein NTY80_02510 [candidate division SR1 bacterium]|nr:hypothetical protein [candidate division SR1 bacterium]